MEEMEATYTDHVGTPRRRYDANLTISGHTASTSLNGPTVHMACQAPKNHTILSAFQVADGSFHHRMRVMESITLRELQVRLRISAVGSVLRWLQYLGPAVTTRTGALP